MFIVLFHCLIDTYETDIVGEGFGDVSELVCATLVPFIILYLAILKQIRLYS